MITEVYGNNIAANYDCRAILAPVNKICNDINTSCLQRLEGAREKTYYSIDQIVEREYIYAKTLGREHLKNLDGSGLPSHALTLKEGAMVMLIRNLNINQGLLNGTRLITKRFLEHQVISKIITEGPFQGYEVILPRINLLSAPTGMPFKLNRIQIPLKLAYAMTINKSQCQTLNKIGIILTPEKQCFSHGHLYAALSRVSSGPSGVAVLSTRRGKNVVYKMVFN